MEKFVMFAIKGTISKWARVAKKVHEIENDESEEHSDQSDYETILLKLLVFRILHILTKSRMKTLISQ